MPRLILRLNEDRLPAASDPVYLPALERTIYVIEGDLTVDFADGSSNQGAGSAWLGGGEIALTAGAEGARLLRWELAPPAVGDRGLLRAAPKADSETKLAVDIELEPNFGWLMRCDRVGFPKGGVAYTHVHQGPGIRYCLEGEIEIRSDGEAKRYGPGEAWFELGSARVLAPTSSASETSFVRGFVLPRGCKGRSSIRYVRPEDAAKPKPQRYQVLGERFIEVTGD
jgi:Cupin domain